MGDGSGSVYLCLIPLKNILKSAKGFSKLIRLGIHEPTFENAMSGNKRLKPSVTFKSSETFMFPGTDEDFRTTVKLTASQAVRVRLHDFNASFTSRQAHDVGLGLIEAIISSCAQDGDVSDRSKSRMNLGFWSTLIERHDPLGSTEQSELLHVLKTGKEFHIAGTLLDPEPTVKFVDGEEPYYDLQIGLDGQHIYLSFGWVRWMFTTSEAEWLAEQLLTAAYLAIKSVRAIRREEA
jgi:hypothetical protein